MRNTFWTKFDTHFYRIKDGILLQAPIKLDDTVDTDNSKIAISISTDLLNLINQEFGSNFISKNKIVKDFN